jgi:alkylation response protein AidB-like acyl-CoA dehydrogenase
MIGPVLMKYGTQAQKDHYLPRMLRLEDWWCQGYSEPGSGSDLASLKTRAERVGDRYIINGQKTWTTMAHHADWIFCLTRTDTGAKAQRGISMILIDMKQPGVTVRPIRTLDGGAEVNEVWLENVEAPLENLVGEENHGWTYAKYLLGHERGGIAGIGHCRNRVNLSAVCTNTSSRSRNSARTCRFGRIIHNAPTVIGTLNTDIGRFYTNISR